MHRVQVCKSLCVCSASTPACCVMHTSCHCHALVPSLCVQVEIEIETCDKGGTFLGTIVLPGAKPINLGITLARMGLAKTQQFFAADRSANRHQQHRHGSIGSLQ